MGAGTPRTESNRIVGSEPSETATTVDDSGGARVRGLSTDAPSLPAGRGLEAYMAHSHRNTCTGPPASSCISSWLQVQ